MPDHYNPLDGDYEYDQAQVKNMISLWRSSYFDECSTFEATIQVRRWNYPQNPKFWKHYVELIRMLPGYPKIVTHRISEQAYNFFSFDKPVEQYTGVQFVILFQHEAKPKVKNENCN